MQLAERSSLAQLVVSLGMVKARTSVPSNNRARDLSEKKRRRALRKQRRRS